jgi:uncharacterized protein with FMN-binding domain
MKKAETGMSRRNFLLGLGAAGGALAMGAAGCAPKASGGAEAPQGQSGETTVATGTGVGRGGEIAVKVALDGTVITSVSVVKHNENLLISDEALSRIPAEIVRTQTTDVDAVSGATLTSFGLKSAVENALANAGLSRNDLTQVAEPAIPSKSPSRPTLPSWAAALQASRRPCAWLSRARPWRCSKRAGIWADAPLRHTAGS